MHAHRPGHSPKKCATKYTSTPLTDSSGITGAVLCDHFNKMHLNTTDVTVHTTLKHILLLNLIQTVQQRKQNKRQSQLSVGTAPITSRGLEAIKQMKKSPPATTEMQIGLLFVLIKQYKRKVESVQIVAPDAAVQCGAG